MVPPAAAFFPDLRFAVSFRNFPAAPFGRPLSGSLVTGRSLSADHFAGSFLRLPAAVRPLLPDHFAKLFFHSARTVRFLRPERFAGRLLRSPTTVRPLSARVPFPALRSEGPFFHFRISSFRRKPLLRVPCGLLLSPQNVFSRFYRRKRMHGARNKPPGQRWRQER